MSDNVMRVPARSLKEQFSRGSEAWKEQSDPIFRFWAEGDWWGFPFFSLSASRYFGDSHRSIGDATETSIADPSGLRILSPFSGLASAL